MNDGGQGSEDNLEMRGFIELKFAELPRKLLFEILKDRGIQTSKLNLSGSKSRP
jgi:hypothetical protein